MEREALSEGVITNGSNRFRSRVRLVISRKRSTHREILNKLTIACC